MSAKQVVAKANLVAAKVDEECLNFDDYLLFGIAKYRIGFVDGLVTTLDMTREERLAEIAKMTKSLGGLLE